MTVRRTAPTIAVSKKRHPNLDLGYDDTEREKFGQRLHDAAALFDEAATMDEHDWSRTRRIIEVTRLLDGIHRIAPYVLAWTVFKVYGTEGQFRPGMKTEWPGCSFFNEAEARAWRDYLADYYDEEGDDPRYDHWVVERAPGPGTYYQFRHVGEPVGTGMDPNRRTRRRSHR